jgi:hypothetical protein
VRINTHFSICLSKQNYTNFLLKGVNRAFLEVENMLIRRNRGFLLSVDDEVTDAKSEKVDEIVDVWAYFL